MRVLIVVLLMYSSVFGYTTLIFRLKDVPKLFHVVRKNSVTLPKALVASPLNFQVLRNVHRYELLGDKIVEIHSHIKPNYRRCDLKNICKTSLSRMKEGKTPLS